MNRPDTHPTYTNLLVLHALRCVGASGPTRLHLVTGLDESDVESELIDLGAAGLLTYTPGAMGGWWLTDAGRAADAERITAELESADARGSWGRRTTGFSCSTRSCSTSARHGNCVPSTAS